MHCSQRFGGMGSAAYQFAGFQYLKVQIFLLKSQLTIKSGITYDRLLASDF